MAGHSGAEWRRRRLSVRAVATLRDRLLQEVLACEDDVVSVGVGRHSGERDEPRQVVEPTREFGGTRTHLESDLELGRHRLGAWAVGLQHCRAGWRLRRRMGQFHLLVTHILAAELTPSVRQVLPSRTKARRVM